MSRRALARLFALWYDTFVTVCPHLIDKGVFTHAWYLFFRYRHPPPGIHRGGPYGIRRRRLQPRRGAAVQDFAGRGEQIPRQYLSGARHRGRAPAPVHGFAAAPHRRARAPFHRYRGGRPAGEILRAAPHQYHQIRLQRLPGKIFSRDGYVPGLPGTSLRGSMSQGRGVHRARQKRYRPEQVRQVRAVRQRMPLRRHP